jgi:Protein of unknown function (DUF3891)
MLLRQLAPILNGGQQNSQGIRPAREVVMEIQSDVKPPYAIVLQSAHSQLAGDFMRALRQDVFGAIPSDVMEAARQHDFGWAESDADQLRRLGERRPQPFSLVPDEAEISSWQSSLRRTEDAAPLINILISRHFCFLSKDNPPHKEFLQRETRRRERIENSLGFSVEDLNRWTAAVGFCDLLSLYFGCGSIEEAEFPLSHPADLAAANAPKVVLSWKDGKPRFSPPMLEPNTFRIEMKEYSGSGTELRERQAEWSFSEG